MLATVSSQWFQLYGNPINVTFRGSEPRTSRLPVECSTDWARTPTIYRVFCWMSSVGLLVSHGLLYIIVIKSVLESWTQILYSCSNSYLGPQETFAPPPPNFKLVPAPLAFVRSGKFPIIHFLIHPSYNSPKLTCKCLRLCNHWQCTVDRTIVFIYGR